MTPRLLDDYAWRLSSWRWPALAVGLAGLVLQHQAFQRFSTRWPRGSLGFAVMGLLGVLGLLGVACYLAVTWFDSRAGTLRRNQPRWNRSDRWLPVRRYGAAAMIDFFIIGAAVGLWLSWWPWVLR